MEASGIILVEDVRTLNLQSRRHVLVLAPEAIPTGHALDDWLRTKGFAIVRRDTLNGLLLVVVEPRVPL